MPIVGANGRLREAASSTSVTWDGCGRADNSSLLWAIAAQVWTNML
eukprot:CAMPEP_0172835412 /NCGR_PEP_ID=MMETSP1075-20121228/25745_1 /TAXON_ID=2916 /ORGANISM="Ceratium fusus, Strain PA161109" /LENGTH=45 /DNA_ID= /DNA_START= /DNA_END= /DNA_ORIENTATION=